MSRRWILTAIGKDRPGIVAGVTKVLYDLGGNLEDSAMTRLAGEFSIMVVFAAPQQLTAMRLEHAFKPTASRLRLAVHVKALAASPRRAPRLRPHLISVYGADRPGIVYRIARLLAQSRVNITDLSTHRTTGSHPLYHLLLEVELPPRLDARRLQRRLSALGRQLGVTVSLRAAETAVL
jgi:glycine cleavage system transcriptional repressor